MRKILSFLILISLLFSANYAMAEDEKVRLYVIDNFSKGLNSHTSPYALPTGYASDCLNVRFNSQYGTLSKRKIMLQYGSVGSHDVTSLHRFYNSDGTTQLLATGSTFAYVGADATGVFTKIHTGLTDGKRFQWETYMDDAIGSNGYDQAIKYDGSINITANTDGHRTAENLCAELGSCYAELDTGTDLDASKWYQYKIAYYDGTTYYYSDAVSNAIQTGAAVHNIALTDIPLGPSGTTHRYIYRTSGAANKAALSGASFYMCYDIANNTATTQADSVSDATLEGDRVPTWTTASGGTDVTVPKAKYITLHKERLFAGGDPSNQSTVYWSEEYLPDYFDIAGDNIEVTPDDGQEITFMKVLWGTLILGKTGSLFKYYTDGTDTTDWYIKKFGNIGCSAPYTAQVTPKGIQFLNKRGMYIFNSQYASLASDVVTDVITDINKNYIEECSAIYFNNEYHLAYTSEATGSTINDRVLVYDFTRDSFTIDTKEVNCFAVLDAGDDDGVIYNGDSNATGYVYANEEETPNIAIRTKTELDAGTHDDTVALGDEENASLEIGWDCTIDTWLTELQTKDASIDTIDDILTYLPDSIIDRPDTDGTWISPVYYINAGSLNKFFWNEDLGESGDIDAYIRLGASEAACSAADWSSSYSDPNGSDISGVTANTYIQVKFELSTSDITVTPAIYLADGYLFKITYYKTGSTKESDVLSYWTSGWDDMRVPIHEKEIKLVIVYYEGDEGEIDITFRNLENTFTEEFTIDLSINPAIDDDDNYYGVDGNKFYFYRPEDGLTGKNWQFDIRETSTSEWKINKIEVDFDVEEYYAA